MPTVLSTVLDFQQSPLGQALKIHWTQLSPDAMEQTLVAASKEAEDYVERKLMAPPVVQLTAGVTPGAVSLPVSTVVGVYPMDILKIGGEAIDVQDAAIASFTSPLPGSINLTGPIAGTYPSGTTVSIYRQDRYEVKGHRHNPIDHVAGLSQEAQLAQMHAPRLGMGDSARKLFLKEYPVYSIAAAYQAYPWTGAETQKDMSSAYIKKEQGIIRLSMGIYNPAGSIWRIQYVAGYQSVPYSVRDAVHLYMAVNIARMMNPLGAIEISGGGQRALLTQRTHSASGSTPRSFYVDEAERKLFPYKRKGR